MKQDVFQTFKAFALVCLIPLVSFFFLTSEFAYANKRKLTLEFEPTEGAVSYEISLIPQHSKNKKALKYITSKPIWEAQVPSGIYLFQVRSLDDRGVPGDWGDPVEVQVQGPPISIVSPQKGEKIKVRESEELHLKWSASQTARDYLVKIRQAEKIVYQESTKSTELFATVPAGQKYEWTVTYQHNGVESETVWTPFDFIGAPLEPPSWKRPKTQEGSHLVTYELPEAAKQNRVTMTQVADNRMPASEQRVLLSRVFNGTEIKLSRKLATGIYQVTGISEGELHEPSEPSTIFLKIKNAEVSASGKSLQELEDQSRARRRWLLSAAVSGVSVDNNSQSSERNSQVSFGGAQGVAGMFGFKVLNYFKDFGAEAEWYYTSYEIEGDGTSGAASKAQSKVSVANWDAYYLLNWNFYSSKLIRQVFIKAGMFYSEVPQFFTNMARTTLAMDNARVMGPEVALESEFALSDKISLSLKGYYMFGIFTLQTPGDYKFDSYSGYDFQLGSLYDFKERWSAGLGLRNRLKTLKTKSQNEKLDSSDENETSLNIRLIYEFK